MQDSFDDQDRFRPVDRASSTFGRKELHLLLLLFIGGLAIDYWFKYHPQQSWRSPIEQPAGLNSAKPSLLL